MKKITALILAAALVLPNIIFFVSASTEPVSVKLFAPPSGVVTMQENVLPDGKYSAVGIPDGVYLNGGAIVMEGTTVKGGDFSITDADGESRANVSVAPYRYFEDFEDGSVGDAVTTTKLEKLSEDAEDKSMFSEVTADSAATALIAGDSSNKYGDGSGVAVPYSIVSIPLGDANSNGKITIKAKILRNNGDAAAPYPGIQLYDKNGVTLFNFRFLKATTTSAVWSKVSQEGQSAAGNGVHLGTVSTNAWYEVVFEIDLKSGTYDAAIGHTITLSDYKMLNTPTNVELGYIQFGVRVDDILIYSGDEKSISMEGSMPEYVTTSKNKKTMLPANVSIEPLGISPEWSTDASGVSVSEGYLCVEPNTLASSALLLAAGYNSTEEYPVSISPAIEEDFEGETVGGDIIDDNGNKYFSGTGNWSTAVSDRLVLNAKVKGTGTVTLKGDTNDIILNINAATDSWNQLDVFVDLKENKYIAALNKKIIDEDTISEDKISGLSTSNVLIDDIYMGSTYDAGPEVLDVIIDGVTMADETVSPVYRYFSALDEAEQSVSYAWYISDTEAYDGEKVSTEEAFKILPEHIGKYIYLGVTVTSSEGDSATSYSPCSLVQDMFTATKLNDGSIKFDINNANGETVMYPFAVLYTNGVISDIYAMNFKNPAVGAVSCTLPVNVNYDGARVFILGEGFVPLSMCKDIGTVPNRVKASGEDGFYEENGVLTLKATPLQTAAIFILKSNPEGSFEKAYTLNNLIINIKEAGGSIKNYIAFADVSETNVSYTLNISKEGYYNAVAIPKSGEQMSAKIGVNPEKMFKSEELKQANQDKFVNIFSNFSSIKADKLREIYSVYNKINNKENVGEFIKAENYNMDYLEAAVYLSAFLEDKQYSDKLTAVLKALDKDTSGVSLIIENADFNKTVAELIAPCALDSYLGSMKEKAILSGIKTAANYLETKVYLEAVGVGEITNAMAKDMCGSEFDSMDELIEAITEYKPSSGGSGSGGSGGGGGSSSGGFGGGGAAVVQKPSASAQKKAAFTDVSDAHWASANIKYFAEKGIIKGYEDGSFKPEKSVTRAEFVKMICEIFEISGTEENFSDVSLNDWFYPYVCASYKAEIVNGFNGLFRPNDVISRQDAAVILHRVADAFEIELSSGTSKISDINDVSNYARSAVNDLSASGIINGMEDGAFLPYNPLTRAQATTILARLIIN